MKDLFLRFSLVFSLLIAISPCNRVSSCFDEPGWEDTRAVFFNPEMGNDSTGLKPFFYTFKYLFPTDYDAFREAGTSNKEGDYRRNCREWQEYLGKNIDPEDIYEVIYGTSADSFSTAYQTRTLHEFLPGNTFLKALQKPAHAAALHYLDFAKRFEFQQYESGSDPWDEPEYYQNWFQRDSVSGARLTAEAAQQLASASDAFLRKRWAYQRINTLYYQAGEGAADSIRQVYKRYFHPDKDNTVLLPWALLKVAEVNDNVGEANYQLALVFDRCQSKRLRAIQLFNSKSAEKAMRFARNAHEKAAVLTLRDIQFPGKALPEIQRIARLDPKSTYLPLLITREINKLEDWILTPRLTGMDAWHSFRPDFDWDEHYDRKIDRWNRLNTEKDKAYLREVRTFTTQLAVKQRNNKNLAPFLQLAVSHLYYLEQRYTDAWRTLQKISDTSDARWRLQKKIQETLLLPLRADVRRASTQAALFERLNFIRKNTTLMADPERQLSRIYLTLSHAFWFKKDVVTAGLLFGRASEHTATRTEFFWMGNGILAFYDNLATFQDLEALERLIENKNKTPFQDFITQPFQGVELGESLGDWSNYERGNMASPVPTAEEIHDLKGTFALRDGDLKRCVREFAQIDTAYWNGRDAYWDEDLCGAVNLIAADSLPPLPGNNKYMIVQKMLNLQEEAARNPAKRAENYYLLGNAWFECSYWGRADMMLAGSGSSSETDAPDPHRRGPTYLSGRPALAKYGKIYYRCTRAAEFFRKSLANHPDPELAARAFYMLAECDRRDRWMTMRRGGGNEGGVASPMFRTWAKRYGKTAAYKECLDACPDLRTYLGK